VTRFRLLRPIAVALLLSAAALPQAYAVDASDVSLETELAGEIATRLIETYNSAAYAAPGFETFTVIDVTS
jgi:hypothetical protein